MMMLAGVKLATLQQDHLFDHNKLSEKASTAVTQNPPG